MISLSLSLSSSHSPWCYTHISDGNGIEKTTLKCTTHVLYVSMPVPFISVWERWIRRHVHCSSTGLLYYLITLLQWKDDAKERREPFRSSSSSITRGHTSRGTTILSVRAALFAMFMLTKWSSIVCITRTIALSDKANYIQQHDDDERNTCNHLRSMLITYAHAPKKAFPDTSF